MNIWRENVAWIDEQHNEYTMEELTDEHLINILNYLSEGNKAHEWLVTDEIVENLHVEAEYRGLKIK